MGITVTIDVIAPAGTMARLMEETVRRLGGTASRTWHWSGVAGPENRELPDSAPNRLALFSTTLESDEAVVVDVAYRSSRGKVIATSASLSGRRFELGCRWRDEGPLTVTFSMSDLAEGFLQDRYGHPPAPPGTDDDAVENAQELFCVVCGALESGDQVLRPDHAAMYIEAMMRPPAACAMVYHRAPREFARDVRRTWLERTQGASPLNMWWQGDETPWVIRKPTDSYDTIFYRGDSDRDARFAWLEGLTERDADLADALDDAEISARLSAVEGERPFLRFLDFGQAGAAVVGSPFDTIWRAYRALAAP